MNIKNVKKATATDMPQVELSGVKDGDKFNHQTLAQIFQQVSSAPAGVTYSVDIDPVTTASVPVMTPALPSVALPSTGISSAQKTEA